MNIKKCIHYSKRTAWSLIYFMNYDYFDISPIRKFWESVSNRQQGSAFFTHKKYPGRASIHRIDELFPLKPSLVALSFKCNLSRCVCHITTQSHYIYISSAMSHFYATEYEICAGFEPVFRTENLGLCCKLCLF